MYVLNTFMQRKLKKNMLLLADDYWYFINKSSAILFVYITSCLLSTG